MKETDRERQRKICVNKNSHDKLDKQFFFALCVGTDAGLIFIPLFLKTLSTKSCSALCMFTRLCLFSIYLFVSK